MEFSCSYKIRWLFLCYGYDSIRLEFWEDLDLLGKMKLSRILPYPDLKIRTGFPRVWWNLSFSLDFLEFDEIYRDLILYSKITLFSPNCSWWSWISKRTDWTRNEGIYQSRESRKMIALGHDYCNIITGIQWHSRQAKKKKERKKSMAIQLTTLLPFMTTDHTRSL